MYIEIPDFLTTDELSKMRDIAQHGAYSGGLTTAPGAAGHKNNEQLEADSAQTDMLRDILLGAVGRSAELQLFTQAKEVRVPLLSRYRDGMRYGRHLDAPILPRGTPMRSDLSMTVFLADPDSYDGGALLLDTDFGEIECKLPAGAAVCYSTLLWHEVEPVTRGERLALVTWFQSRVRDPSKRALLFDVGMAAREVATAAPGSPTAERLERATANMTRLWSDV